jgi:hypothetical protein
MGGGGIAPCILDLGIRWNSVVSFMTWLLYAQGKSPWYPMDRRLKTCAWKYTETIGMKFVRGVSDIMYLLPFLYFVLLV